jgi:replicative DNA helicase
MRDAPSHSLPNNVEAEMALLGAIFYDNALLDRFPDLRPDHFYEPVNAIVFGWLRAGRAAGRHGLDAVSLKPQAEKDPAFASVGGPFYLIHLLERAARLESHAMAYASSVMDAATRREIIASAREIEALALSPLEGATAQDIAEEGEKTLRALAMQEAPAAWRRIGEITDKAVKDARAGKARGVKTGISGIDDHTNGGKGSKLWVIGGASSMGKSVGGQEIAVNVAKQGLGVAYFHLEMDEEEIGLRVASRFAWRPEGVGLNWRDSNPPYLDAARGKLTSEQWSRMEQAAEATRDLPVWVDTTPGLTLPQIETRARRLLADMERAGVTPTLIVIDHQGLIANHERHASELEAARARGNQLKAIAKRLNVWLVALAQVTKEGARKDGEEHLPTLDDIAYGGALTQAADVVILLHRKAYYAERKPAGTLSMDDQRAKNSLIATLIIDKARGGRRGRVDAIMDVSSAILRDAQAGELDEE